MTASIDTARMHSDEDTRSARGGLWALSLVGFTVALLLLPILLIDVPPMGDYAAHLSRMWILTQDGADPLTAAQYVRNIGWQPNLAMDLAVPFMAPFLGFALANRVFIVLCVLVPVLGVACLQRALFGRWSLWSLASAFFVYNALFMTGFLNFSVGLGLALLAAAAWIGLQERHLAVRLSFGLVSGLVLYVCHLFAILAFGILLFSFEAERLWRWRRPLDLLVLAAPFALPFGLFIATRELSGQIDAYAFGSIGAKLRAAASPLINYVPVLDAATALLWVTLIVVGLAARALRLDRRMIPGLVICVAGWALVPGVFLQSGWFDSRFPMLAAFMFVAGSLPAIVSAARLGAVAAILVAVFVVRMGLVGYHWMAARADLAEIRMLDAAIAPGASVLVAYAGEDWRDAWRNGPPHRFNLVNQSVAYQLPALAVMERSAFVPLMFAHPGKHSIAVTPAYRSISSPTWGIPTLTDLIADRGNCVRYWCGWRATFDYVVLVHVEQAHPAPPPELEPVFAGPLFELYRVRKAPPVP